MKPQMMKHEALQGQGCELQPGHPKVRDQKEIGPEQEIPAEL
eukprot:CAMPEP_0181503082 /NCGR_PEP_ID=MMETSP1110-20121109/56726_1 /TAXON_ID=174948 /ORGANISM="Symbiodinium sp., Strain CCMP421" /LENGTH=41 /DNA_ID= /DNA_START= /DNA_END= /DNA_ORIENTATION=